MERPALDKRLQGTTKPTFVVGYLLLSVWGYDINEKIMYNQAVDSIPFLVSASTLPPSSGLEAICPAAPLPVEAAMT